MILYPENYEKPADDERSIVGRDKEFAKTVIRYAVGSNDSPMHGWQLINLICGNITKDTAKILKPLRRNKIALLAKISELGIPKVSSGLTPEERIDCLNRARNNLDLRGPTECKSLSRGEVVQCIKEVIAERQDTWDLGELE